MDFIALRMNGISMRKCIVDMDVVNDVTYSCQNVITHIMI